MRLGRFCVATILLSSGIAVAQLPKVTSPIAELEAIKLECKDKPACIARLTQERTDQESALNVRHLRGELSIFAGVTGVGWESAVLEGLSGFLADRAQQELIAWFLDSFTRRLCEAEGAPLFVETCKVLSRPAVKVAPGALFVSALREDLMGLPVRLMVRIAESCVGSTDSLCLRRADKLGTGLAGALQALRRGASPIQALGSLGLPVSSVPGYTAEPDLAKQQLWEVASSYCRDTSRTHLGCLLGASGTVLINSGDLFVSGTNVETWAEQVLAAGLLDALKKFVPQTTTVETAKPAVIKVGKSILELDRLSTQWTSLPAPSAAETLRRASVLFNTVSDLWFAMDALVAGEFDAEPVKQLSAAAAMLSGDPADSLRQVIDWIPGPLQKFAGLVAELASARDAQSVQALVQAHAAPIGSWRRKHESVALGISAFVGGLGGVEFALGRSSGPAAGLTAQLGLDLMGPCAEGKTRVGFFISILDLGQLTWARIDAAVRGKEGPQPQPELGFIQVLSPGLYFAVGPGRSPFTLLAGASIAPQLRGYITSAGATEPATVLRLGLGLAVDLSLLPLTH